MNLIYKIPDWVLIVLNIISFYLLSFVDYEPLWLSIPLIALIFLARFMVTKEKVNEYITEIND